MRMIDFPFGDCCGKRCYGRDGCIEGHMNLAKGKCLIERAWVFKVKWGVGDEDVVGEAFTVASETAAKHGLEWDEASSSFVNSNLVAAEPPTNLEKKSKRWLTWLTMT